MVIMLAAMAICAAVAGNLLWMWVALILGCVVAIAQEAQ